MQEEEIQLDSSTDSDRAKMIRDKENVKDPVMMAMFMIQEYPDIIRCGVGDQQNIYRFNGKCFDIVTDRDLERLLLAFLIKYGVTTVWRNKYLIISAFLASPTAVVIDKMNDYDNLICLNNGILNIHTKEFIPHSNKYYFDSYVNVDYDPEAKLCPVFVDYLNHTFNNDKETITNIIRLGGYLLDTSCAAERMFIFDGLGSNGKSVLINTFQLFFADNQITPLSLDVMASNGFSKELLISSRVNFCAEQKKAMLDVEEIKKIITGDKIEINRKFKISLSFTPKTKLIVACNGLPRFSDTTHAIYRRMIIVKFPNQYLNETEYKKLRNPDRIGAYLKDKDLFYKIKEEKSAILNLFIGGLVDLRSNKYEFIESPASLASMVEFKRSNDTVREFLEDNYEVVEEGNDGTPLSEIYNHYREWYHRNVQDSGGLKFRINEMGKRLREIFGVESMGQKYVWNNNSQRKEKETMYPIRLLVAPEDVEEMMTEEQAMSQGVIFNDK